MKRINQQYEYTGVLCDLPNRMALLCSRVRIRGVLGYSVLGFGCIAFSVHANSARTGLMGWPSMVCDGIANGLSFATLIKKRPERCRKRRIS